ncbi:MAG: hypothetical protein AMJ53_14800 [Gammaproteobacteria bacterium SG8_11]|nr:MAG: hypothetical protein AMJ53_14800 [Gammaproteobacteria bacterium SG8_11]
MQKLRVFLVSFIFTVYEILLVIFAIHAADSAINIWNDLPLFKSNTEFILVLGQAPAIALFAWWYYRKKNALEKDFIEKYRKKAGE